MGTIHTKKVNARTNTTNVAILSAVSGLNPFNVSDHKRINKC